MTFTEKLISQNGHLIHKLKAKDTKGRWAYYFLLVQPHKESAFLKAINSEGTLDLVDYGILIGSCIGEEPNDTLKKMLLEKYGFIV